MQESPIRFSVSLHGRLVEFSRPAVMGIVNVTPDSFYRQSRTTDTDAVRRRVAEMIGQGVDIIDVGAYSSRPGADDVSPDDELRRLETGLRAIRDVSSDIPVSVDTFRASVARTAVSSLGADIVNDISGGMLDDDMFATVAELRCPYILMHMRGTPDTMQSLTDYPQGVTPGVIAELAARMSILDRLGVSDVVIDPGFGFAKTLKQNYELMHDLPEFAVFGRPLLAGISRKSMLTRLLGCSTDQALDATTALNTIALQRGADIIRVHDVAAARAAVDVYCAVDNPDGIDIS